jgi:WD40 repeat protein
MSQLQKYLLSGAVLILMSGKPIVADEPAALPLTLPSGAIARLGVSRFLNFGRVFSVAFSPDGNNLATGAWDGTVRVWELPGGKELHLFQEQNGPAKAVAFSPDSKLLACAGKSADIVLLDVVTGKEVKRLKGHTGAITCLAFSPDGKLLASKAYDQTSRLWDVDGAREVRRLASQDSPKQGNDPESPLAFASDGKTLVSATSTWGQLGGSTIRTFHIWDAATGEEVRSFQDNTPWINAVAISPASKLLAVGIGYVRGGPPRINLWDLDSGKALPPIELARDVAMISVASLAFSPDGKTLATSNGGSIQLWEIATRREAVRIPSPDNGAANLAFSPTGRILASGSTDFTALLWDLTGRKERSAPSTIKLSSKEWQTFWDDLADPDAFKARRAIWAFIGAGSESVDFLQARLQPVTSSASTEVIGQLVADLNSPDYAVRNKASAQLIQLAELAEPALVKAQKDQPSLELRRRVDDILKLLADSRAKPSGDRLRGWRAVEILEQIDTPGARQLLQTLSRGAAGAVLTREAEASLARLERKAILASPSR